VRALLGGGFGRAATSSATKQNILTVDVEEWYHPSLCEGQRHTDEHEATRLEQNIEKLLDRCEAHDAHATFFVLGSVAERKPWLVRMIRDAGQDIAIHGYDHRLVYRQTRQDFEADVKKALDVVQEITGKGVRGYRAPSWSITEGMFWVYETLDRLGLEYDASVFPFKTFLYGMPNAPRFPYYPTDGRRSAGVIEVPASTVRLFGMNLPFAGGFYLRMLPWAAISLAIRRVNGEGYPAILYIHPYEIDPRERRAPLGARDRFIQYGGISGALDKLERLLATFSLTSIEKALDSGLLRS